LAKERAVQIYPGPQRDVMDSWIKALEEQITRLEEIRDEMEVYPATGPRNDQTVMAEHLAGNLLECIALAPLEAPAEAGLLGVEETLSWGSVRLAYKREDCAEANEQYEAQMNAVPAGVVPVDVQVQRAICLSRSGKYNEAIQLLEHLLEEEVELLDAQYLRYLLANWQFQESLLDRAGETYQSVVHRAREREHWEELAKVRIAQIRLQRGEPLTEEPATTLVDSEGASTLAAAPSWSVSPQEEIQSIEPPSVEAPTRDPQMDTAAASDEKVVPSIYEIRDAKLQEAQKLLDSEQYEGAVIAYRTLLGTEYDSMAQEGIQQAQNLFAEKGRRQAASLVLRAHGEADAKSKKALMIQALRLLQDINARYPGNRYAVKVQQNIRDVVDQIQGMDPDFNPYAPVDLSSREAS
jgi:tetratricopeptide (TPR) repeat protein